VTSNSRGAWQRKRCAGSLRASRGGRTQARQRCSAWRERGRSRLKHGAGPETPAAAEIYLTHIAAFILGATLAWLRSPARASLGPSQGLPEFSPSAMPGKAMNIDRQRVSAVSSSRRWAGASKATGGSRPRIPGDELQTCISILSLLRALLASAGCSGGPKGVMLARVDDLPRLEQAFAASPAMASVICHYQTGRPPELEVSGVDSSDPLAHRGKHALLTRRDHDPRHSLRSVGPI
jgi:hypothetical protein